MKAAEITWADGVYIVTPDQGQMMIHGPGPWRVEVKPWKKARSNPQNRLFHGICGRIAEKYHMTIDEVKTGVKFSAGWTRLDPMGREVPRTSADCDTVEMARLTEYAIKEALELGVYIQDVLDSIE